MSDSNFQKGDAVVLKPGHPWARKTGVIQGMEQTPFGRKWKVALNGLQHSVMASDSQLKKV